MEEWFCFSRKGSSNRERLPNSLSLGIIRSTTKRRERVAETETREGEMVLVPNMKGKEGDVY